MPLSDPGVPGAAAGILAQLGRSEAKAYAVINPGKRGMTLDLTAADAAQIVGRLFAWADVALVAFKQADLACYGIDYESARSVNGRIVHLTHTPFGPEGTDADLGGYDVLVQGRSGIGFAMNRTEGGVPLATRPAVHDFATGIAGALGVVAALRHRDLTGEGQRVIPGGGVFRLYFRHYVTADGLISVAGLSIGLFRKFHEVTGLPIPPMGDPHGAEFDEIVGEADRLFRTRTTREWIDALRAGGYPCGPYNLPHEAIDDEQVQANSFVVDLEHPVFGRYTAGGEPLRFSAAPSPGVSPSPTLGQHTAEVLAEIGFDPGSIEEFVAAGTVSTPEHIVAR